MGQLRQKPEPVKGLGCLSMKYPQWGKWIAVWGAFGIQFMRRMRKKIRPRKDTPTRGCEPNVVIFPPFSLSSEMGAICLVSHPAAKPQLINWAPSAKKNKTCNWRSQGRKKRHKFSTDIEKGSDLCDSTPTYGSRGPRTVTNWKLNFNDIDFLFLRLLFSTAGAPFRRNSGIFFSRAFSSTIHCLMRKSWERFGGASIFSSPHAGHVFQNSLSKSSGGTANDPKSQTIPSTR